MIKSSFLTNFAFLAPKSFIFSLLLQIYLTFSCVSPIFIHGIPLSSSVMKFLIGRGEAPREIFAISPRVTNLSLYPPFHYDLQIIYLSILHLTLNHDNTHTVEYVAALHPVMQRYIL